MSRLLGWLARYWFWLALAGLALAVYHYGLGAALGAVLVVLGRLWTGSRQRSTQSEGGGSSEKESSTPGGVNRPKRPRRSGF